MLRSFWSCLVAASFVVASSSGAVAETWRQTYYMQTNTLQGVLEEDELLTMAYLKVPFGGRLSKPNKAVWGLSLNSRLPYYYGHLQFGDHAGVATIMDLRFDGRKVDDFMINGLSTRAQLQRMNASGDGASPWVTYGIMAAALGVGALVILAANGDKENPITRDPGRAQGAGCGDGQGPGAGNGQGSGDMGAYDPRINPATGACTAGTGTGNGDGMGPGAGDGTGDGNMGNGSGDGGT